jgi:hypothetical protein
MSKRIPESVSIIGGTILSIVPYFQQGANMNLTSWIFVGVGFSLVLFGVLYGIFKPEKHMKLKDKNELLIRRRDYLQKLKDIIRERLSILGKLATEATKLSLTNYRDKYLKYSWSYKLSRLIFCRDEDLAIVNALSWSKFEWNNLYFTSLRENSVELAQVMVNYDTLCAEETNKKLRNVLNSFWRYAHRFYSIRIYALLSKNNPHIRNMPIGLRIASIGQQWGDSVLNENLEKIWSIINDLLEGEDL